jgi:hypothetical protein
MSPTFAARWFEIDPAFQFIRLLASLRIIDMTGAQRMKWRGADDTEQPAPLELGLGEAPAAK